MRHGKVTTAAGDVDGDLLVICLRADMGALPPDVFHALMAMREEWVSPSTKVLWDEALLWADEAPVEFLISIKARSDECKSNAMERKSGRRGGGAARLHK
jgi:hypothetical protein